MPVTRNHGLCRNGTAYFLLNLYPFGAKYDGKPIAYGIRIGILQFDDNPVMVAIGPGIEYIGKTYPFLLKEGFPRHVSPSLRPRLLPEGKNQKGYQPDVPASSELPMPLLSSSFWDETSRMSHARFYRALYDDRLFP